MTFYKIVRWLVSGFFRLFYRIHVTGEENIPDTGAVLIAANHTSAADPIVLGVVAERQIRFIGKAELFKIPLIGRILRVLGAFPVNRNEGDVAALKKSLAILADGEMLCVFPQGTRCPGEEIKDTADRVKPGVGLMALKSGAVVVPVCIRTRKNRTRIFRRTDVIFGHAIQPEQLSGFLGRSKYNDAAMYIFDCICELDRTGSD